MDRISDQEIDVFINLPRPTWLLKYFILPLSSSVASWRRIRRHGSLAISFILFKSTNSITILLFTLTVVTFVSLVEGHVADPPRDQTIPPVRTAELLACQLTMITLAISIVILRLISRYVVLKKPGWDDYAIMVATVLKTCIHYMNAVLIINST